MKGDWYFEGYEGRRMLDGEGKARRELVYTGEYYGFAKGQNPAPIKAVCGAAALVYLVCFFLNATNVSTTSTVIYVGFPMLISAVPAIYLVMGTACFMPARSEMTVRVCYSSLRRMDRALRIMVPLLAVSFIGGLVRFIMSPALFASISDLGYLICVAISFVVILAEFIILRRNPVIIVRSPSVGSRRIEELEKKKKKHRRW